MCWPFDFKRKYFRHIDSLRHFGFFFSFFTCSFVTLIRLSCFHQSVCVVVCVWLCACSCTTFRMMCFGHTNVLDNKLKKYVKCKRITFFHHVYSSSYLFLLLFYVKMAGHVNVVTQMNDYKLYSRKVKVKCHWPALHIIKHKIEFKTE